MVLKPGTSNFKNSIPVNRRHNKVGETYKDRQDYQKAHDLKESKSTFFGKVKDFFSGSKSDHVHSFASNSAYTGTNVRSAAALQKQIENGTRRLDSSNSDQNLLSILNDVVK